MVAKTEATASPANVIREWRADANEARRYLRQQGLGLCSTCACAPDCAFRSRNDGPVVFCEEFSSAVDAAYEPSVCAAAAACDDPPAQQVGLCVNCAQRDACSFPRPVSGVWHCEEYE